MAFSENKSLVLPLPRPLEWGFNFRLTLIERKILLFLGDAVCAALACIGALWLWSFTSHESLTFAFIQYNSNWITIFTLLWLFSAWLLDLYHLKSATQPLTVFLRLGGVAALILGGYLLIFFVRAYIHFLPRLPLLYALMLAFVSTNIWRWLYGKTIGQELFRQRLLIIGSGWAGQTMAEAIQHEAQHHFQLLGFVDDVLPKRGSTVPLLGSTHELLQLAHEYRADAIVYAVPHQLRAESFQILLDCQAAGLSIIQMPALYETLTGRVPVEHVRNDWLLPVEVTGGRNSLAYYFFVHLLDWGFSVVAGFFFLFIAPIIALLIKLDSPGPIFYRQVRLGKGGQPFELIKFRSMTVNAEQSKGAQWATKNDVRVTRIGRLMRDSRLDELPQILNILRGDIHLIGPRPERPEFVEQLEKEIPFYRARLVMKPGLTGWAQVKYRYGSTVEDALMKLQYDLYYIKNRSAWLDLSILAKTVGVVLTFKGT